MEDEEDDVFEPDLHCWHTTFRQIKCEDRATQTPGPALAPNKGMLPCGVAEEPRPLFYGTAGFRLHFPAHFELSEDQEASGSLQEGEMQNGGEPLPRQPLAARSMEACIGHKLQLIGDQFHRDHLQRALLTSYRRRLVREEEVVCGPCCLSKLNTGQCDRLPAQALRFHIKYHQNQRNQGPVWWRLAAALLSLLFDRGGRAAAGQR